MGELEPFAGTRVRIGGNNSDRRTGNLVTATFTHETSRALDPHLHTHCIVFNATFDPVEKRWKALQNFEMLRAQKYVENVYYHVLARELINFGYGISNRRRGDFDLQGIPQAICDRFSKRHAEIDALTQFLLHKKPEKAKCNIAAVRELLAQNNRSRKVRNIESTQLRELWNKQLTPAEVEAINNLRAHPVTLANSTANTPGAALAFAEAHLFERRSVVLEHQLWRCALEFGRGGRFEIEELKAESQCREYVRDNANPEKLTTRRTLAVEQEIVRLARSGIGQCRPLGTHSKSCSDLDADQLRVVAEIMGSRDFVTLFRGAAGTGKSRTLSEVFARLKEAGYGVHVLAPQRQQALDLAASRMKSATTLSEFLARKPVQRGEVIIVDEAGQIGGEEMLALLSTAKNCGCRLIFSGDTRQHGAVEASDALRAMERFSGLSVAELTKIRRQDPERARTEAERAFVLGYRQAVEAASQGDSARSFEKLESIGAVVMCVPGSQHEKLAAQFVDHMTKKESALVVAQTWGEIHRLNDTIRAALKSAGHLPRKERLLKAREPMDLSNAQKRDPRYYDTETVVVFRRNGYGFERNQTARVIGALPASLVVESRGQIRAVPFSRLDQMTVCREREMAISVGERLQLKANAKTGTGRRLTNGELVTVSAIHPGGKIELKDGRVLESSFRDFVHGYAVTSYGSQGKTVDHVLFSDSAVRAATNQQQWYVTISRGRKGIRIFTEDREGLAENIQRSGERELALELKPKAPKQVQTGHRQGVQIRRAVEKLRQLAEGRINRKPQHKQTP